MTRAKFDSIIEFAIEREEEAVKFYSKLQSKANFKGQVDFLKELENMEKGHIQILKQIQQVEVDDLDVPEVENLKISDYVVSAKPEDEMTYQDILITAMKREEASLNLYTTLANNFDDPQTNQLFKKIASEEAKHKLKFEELYDQDILKEN